MTTQTTTQKKHVWINYMFLLGFAAFEVGIWRSLGEDKALIIGGTIFMVLPLIAVVIQLWPRKVPK
ncbi:hypothetical protein [Vibrio sp. SCSIO 43136]|uniref:hypothetical protein n=1 Tax=Vibrio sp. SCSIO 43136 TaxID=2819101 RepID=UPI0020761611|nr:hypothetical protein [Vibrio sp. SCSIO 43136]USD68128.1 hypothetical protein J4N39_18310 [Vibrio sp. SCSIO 43136]